jgi:hypothetical protein
MKLISENSAFELCTATEADMKTAIEFFEPFFAATKNTSDVLYWCHATTLIEDGKKSAVIFWRKTLNRKLEVVAAVSIDKSKMIVAHLLMAVKKIGRENGCKQVSCSTMRRGLAEILKADGWKFGGLNFVTSC